MAEHFWQVSPNFSSQWRGPVREGYSLDAPACIQIAERFGVSPDMAAILLPHYEAGARAGAAKNTGQGS